MTLSHLQKEIGGSLKNEAFCDTLHGFFDVTKIYPIALWTNYLQDKFDYVRCDTML